MFAIWANYDSQLKTETPWGQVTVNTTGHCADNGCGGHSCYDFATIRGLDREVNSIAIPGGETLQDPSFEALIGFGSLDELQAAYESEQYDFYQTLEDFACCDCTDCMRLTDCYANITQVPGDISCADIWQQVIPFVSSKAELMDVLNTLNVGGCYWCNDLYSQLSDTAVRSIQNNFEFYDFPFPDENSVVSTEETTTTSQSFGDYYSYSPLESCTTVGCGNVGTECSCDINCAADYETTLLPCCFDYEEAGCQAICPSESYQVGRVDDTSYYGYEAANFYSYLFYYDLQNVDAYERYSCDDIISLFALSDDTERFTCDDLESLYGLDCRGCFCADPVTDAATTRPECSDADAQCGFGWVDPMSCDSLIEASRATLEVYPDELQSHLTCASLEDLGCNCQGCACEREPVCAGTYDYEGTIGVEVLCMGGMSCDYWSARLPGVTCEILEEEYGCNCDYCSCDLEVPDTTPEPECECEVSYEMASLDGSDGTEMVTCDTFSAFVEPNGLCCGVMEYALQMDCSGCCCDAPACETCLENSTTTSTSTSTTTTTTSTSTTRPCPENDNFYDACSYSSTCSNGEVVLTNLYQRTYDCFWVDNYLNGVCFKPPNAVDCNITDDQCANLVNSVTPTTCRLDTNGDPKCQFCPTDSIPGQPEGPGKSPCYYPNHVDPDTGIPDPLYSAYDCVADHQSGKGCIYIDAPYDEKVDSFCQIKLQNVNCPNPPPACDSVCTPQWLPQGQCSKACGTGQRFLEYNCLPTQEIDGVLVDCGLDDGETLNCEAPAGSVATIGAFNIGACNTQLCTIEGAVCSNTLIGDGYCDWTAEADYARMFSDGELESANNNLDDCDWDGGDCCAYSCDTTITTPNTWGDPIGATCAWGGGGCHKVDEAGKNAAVAAAFWFNPAGGLGANAGISCVTRDDGFYDCCQDIVLFDSSTLAGSFPCTYGDVDFLKCAEQGNHCLDPAAGGLSTTETTPTP